MEPVKPPSVGRNIQRIRKQQQLTLGVLAERSGVSKAMLSQIESEKVNPTVATVWKIARGLEVELDELLKGAEVPVRKFLVARQEEHTTLDGPQGAPRIEVLSPLAMAEDLEIYLLTFEREAVLRSSPHAPQTEEYLSVIEGRVKVRAGDKSSDIAAGDFVIYNCDVEHSIENLADGPSRVHMIVRFVRRQWD